MIDPQSYNMQTVTKIKDLTDNLDFFQKGFAISTACAFAFLILLVYLCWTDNRYTHQTHLLQNISSDIKVVKNSDNRYNDHRQRYSY